MSWLLTPFLLLSWQQLKYDSILFFINFQREEQCLYARWHSHGIIARVWSAESSGLIEGNAVQIVFKVQAGWGSAVSHLMESTPVWHVHITIIFTEEESHTVSKGAEVPAYSFFTPNHISSAKPSSCPKNLGCDLLSEREVPCLG